MSTSSGPLLAEAVAQRNLEVVQRLLFKKVDPNSKDLDGFCPIHIATQMGDEEMMRILFASRADVNVQDAQVGHFFGAFLTIFFRGQHAFITQLVWQN